MADLGLTCLLDPFGCAQRGFDTWLHSIPLGWLLLGAVVVGMLIGAWLGKIGVFALIGAVLAAVVLSRRGGSDDVAENVDGEDAKPSHPKPKKPRDAPDLSGIFSSKKR
jgi:hypothetical protein